MINYYKYLPVSDEDKNWGLHVLSAGCSHIEKSTIYPPKSHPSHHYFRWDQGRVFDEFQIIYIASGEGIFESATTSKVVVNEGTIILLFPKEWHRF
ncbi:MAG TPA: AraC family ligand binding domain-containing protein, partial [Puia sp.]